MLTRLLPIQNMVTNRLLGRRSLEAAADRVEVIQPAEIEHYQIPIAALPGQVEKVTAATHLDATYVEQVEYSRNADISHDPVVRYTFRDCLVHDCGFDAARFSFRIRPPAMADLLPKETRAVKNAVYCNTAVTHEYFGHWLHDACATAQFKAPDEKLFLEMRPDWLKFSSHISDYATAFGYAPEPRGATFVEQLTVYQDHGQGSLKRARYAQMRRKAAEALATGQTGPKAVYFRRGSTGVERLIANDAEVAEALSSRGFEIIDLNGKSCPALYNAFKDARLVVSIDGSHLNHLYISMPEGASVLALIPSNRFTLTEAGYARAVGLRYGFLVITPTPAGYDVSIPDLLRTIDLLV